MEEQDDPPGRVPRQATRKYRFTPEGNTRAEPTPASKRCRRRPRLPEVLLLILAIVLLIVLIAVTVVLTEANEDLKEKYQSTLNGSLCMSQQCITAAASISSYIDPSVEPCKDFYQFACGSWLKMSTVPADASQTSILDGHNREMEIVLKKLLEAKEQNSDWASINQAKRFYKSCMDEELISYVKDTELKEILKGFGEWPMGVKDWNIQQIDPIKLLANLTMLNSHPLFQLFVDVDPNDTSKYILQVRQPLFWMTRFHKVDAYQNDTWIKRYRDSIGEVNKLLYDYDENIDEDRNNLVNFERQLARSSVVGAGSLEFQNMQTRMTLGDFSKANPIDAQKFTWNWISYFNAVMLLAGKPLVDTNDIIINHSPGYFRSVRNYLYNTPERTLANYLIWKFVSQYTGIMGEHYDAINESNMEQLFGALSMPARYRFCTHSTLRHMRLPVTKLNMRVNDRLGADYGKVTDLLNTIRIAYYDLLNTSNWMTDTLKRTARDKIQSLTTKIGYEKILQNEAGVNALYRNYTVEKKKFFNSVIEITKLEAIRQFRKLGTNVDKTEWKVSSLYTHPVYSLLQNELTIPAGSLQSPFFNLDYPGYLNYGNLGVSIGRAMGNAVNDLGLQNDKQVKLINQNDGGITDRFKQRDQCFISKDTVIYFPEFNAGLNRTNVKRTIRSDFDALKLAFKAYNDSLHKQRKDDLLLPGLNYNQRQLFFITFAQSKCDMYIQKFAQLLNNGGDYNPGRYKVYSIVNNSIEFLQVFNCERNPLYENNCDDRRQPTS